MENKLSSSSSQDSELIPAPRNRRFSLRPPSPTGSLANARRGSRGILDQKDISPALLKLELLNRVMSLSLKRDWPAVDQHLCSLEKNNLDLSTSSIEVILMLSTVLIPCTCLFSCSRCEGDEVF